MKVEITAFVHLVIYVAPLLAPPKSVTWLPSLHFHLRVTDQELFNEAFILFNRVFPSFILPSN